MKYLIKNNEIVMSGIPGHFEREDGEEFWGGYENRTDIHYEDGWRDEVIPEFDPLVQYLGAAFYDAENDVVTYPVLQMVIDVEAEKARLLSEFTGVKREIVSLIMEAQLSNDPVPEGLQNLMSITRQINIRVKEDIASLTEEDVMKFRLRTPEFYQLVEAIKAFL
jgi:hypothetical protein